MRRLSQAEYGQWHRKLQKHDFLVMTCLEARAVTHTGVWVSMCTLLGDKVGLLYLTWAVVLHPMMITIL